MFMAEQFELFRRDLHFQIYEYMYEKKKNYTQ